MELNISQYAAHRGVTRGAVQKAIKTGKIRPVRTESQGKNLIVFLDSVKSDRDWKNNTDPGRRRTLTRAEMGKSKSTKSELVPETKTTDKTKTNKHGTSANTRIFNGDDTYLKARGVREDIQAKLALLEFDKKSGKSIDVDAVSQAWFMVGKNIQQNLMTIGPRIASIVAPMANAKEIEDIINYELKVALRVLNETPSH